MRLSKYILPFIATSFLSTGALAADNWPAWYVGLHGGVTLVHETDAEVAGASVGDVAFNAGHAAGASLGYQYSDYTRFELEYTHRSNGFDTLDNGAGSTDLQGDLKVDAVMANLLFDFPSQGSKWTPYFGGGLGIANVSFDSPTLNIDDSDNVFAYQVLLGTSYSPKTLPNTTWGIGYRFLGMASPEFVNSTNQNVEHDYYSHGLEANAKFRF